MHEWCITLTSSRSPSWWERSLPLFCWLHCRERSCGLPCQSSAAWLTLQGSLPCLSSDQESSAIDWHCRESLQAATLALASLLAGSSLWYIVRSLNLNGLLKVREYFESKNILQTYNTTNDHLTPRCTCTAQHHNYPFNGWRISLMWLLAQYIQLIWVQESIPMRVHSVEFYVCSKYIRRKHQCQKFTWRQFVAFWIITFFASSCIWRASYLI